MNDSCFVLDRYVIFNVLAPYGSTLQGARRRAKTYYSDSGPTKILRVKRR